MHLNCIYALLNPAPGWESDAARMRGQQRPVISVYFVMAVASCNPNMLPTCAFIHRYHAWYVFSDRVAQFVEVFFQ